MILLRILLYVFYHIVQEKVLNHGNYSALFMSPTLYNRFTQQYFFFEQVCMNFTLDMSHFVLQQKVDTLATLISCRDINLAVKNTQYDYETTYFKNRLFSKLNLD